MEVMISMVQHSTPTREVRERPLLRIRLRVTILALKPIRLHSRGKRSSSSFRPALGGLGRSS